MGDGDRLEIELTPNGAAAATSTFDDGPSPLTRVAVAALVAAVIGMFAGWVGHGLLTDDGSAESAATTTVAPTTAPATTTVPPGFERVDAPERSTTTTTTEPDRAIGDVTDVDMNPDAIGYPFTVLTIDGGDVLATDFEAGRQTYLGSMPDGMSRLPGSVHVLAGDGWVVLAGDQSGTQQLVGFSDGAPPVERELDLPVIYWKSYVDPSGDRLWLSSVREGLPSFPGPDRLVEFGVDLEPTGRVINLPAPAVSLTSSGPLVGNVNGLYLLTDDGPQRITTGEVVAYGDDRVLANLCDERYECRLVMTEFNGSGIVASSDIDAIGELLLTGWDAASISPDGRWLASATCMPIDADGSASWDEPDMPVTCFVDLDTGERFEQALQRWGRAPQWSDDSSAAIMTSETGAIVIFDTETTSFINTGITDLMSRNGSDLAVARNRAPFGVSDRAEVGEGFGSAAFEEVVDDAGHLGGSGEQE